MAKLWNLSSTATQIGHDVADTIPLENLNDSFEIMLDIIVSIVTIPEKRPRRFSGVSTGGNCSADTISTEHLLNFADGPFGGFCTGEPVLLKELQRPSIRAMRTATS